MHRSSVRLKILETINLAKWKLDYCSPFGAICYFFWPTHEKFRLKFGLGTE
jgi:hypothetical protein